MAGFCGILYRNGEKGAVDSTELFPSIDLLGKDERQEFSLRDGVILISSRRNSPVKGKHFYEDQDMIAVFTGDLVGPGSVPWGMVKEAVQRDDFFKFTSLRGIFAFAVYVKDKDKLLLITDRFGFFPIYYEQRDNGSFAFSTSIGTFARLGTRRELSRYWVYEYFYFSFPVLDTTIYTTVKRLRHASVLFYSRPEGELTIKKYAKDYRRNPSPLTGKKALDRAGEVFSSVVPLYFTDADSIAHALTAGYDTRTILVFCPREKKHDVITYTYGIKGCGDLTNARRIAGQLGFNHREIYFDENFISKLPELMVDTVYLSSLLENINRSYLPYIYNEITERGTRHQVIMSGIGGDALFRGHVPVPNGLSVDMERTFISGKKHISGEFFKKVFGKNFDEFYQYIDTVLDRMQESYGEFSDRNTFFYYQIYDGLIKYFNGEVYIANNFGSFRIPFFDPDIIQLACDIEYSTFKLIRFFNDDTYIGSLLQAHLMSLNPESARVKIHGLPLRAFTVNNKFIYNIYRLFYKGPDKVKKLLGLKKVVPLEKWDEWQRGVMAGRIKELLSEEAMLYRFLNRSFVDEAIGAGDVHWTKISASAEISLRLMEAGWERD